MEFKKYIMNKSAWRRITRIYLPIIVMGYIILNVLSVTMVKYDKGQFDHNTSFAGQTPVVYHKGYNISFFGLEQAHPFDTHKYKGVYQRLKKNGLENEIQAVRASDKLLLQWQDKDYLTSLQSSWNLARVLELRFLRFFPSQLSQNLVLEPMRLQTGGSVMAGLAALEHGWAINLGGGFHHASFDNGEGFCALDDIGLVVKYLRSHKNIKKFMIIDLDAHQGNGHGRDFIDDENVYILDIYNGDIYPHDHAAKKAIDYKVELPSFTSDAEYLSKLRIALTQAFNEFTPEIILYVAGTDGLIGDPLGALDISEKAIIKRDQLVFDRAKKDDIPIVMMLAGGYQKSNAAVIANSILNLREKHKLF